MLTPYREFASPFPLSRN